MQDGKGLFGANWGMGNLKDKLGGLLSDPQQQMALLQSPMFGAGMGLLASGYDGNINPFQAAMSGIAGAQQSKQADEDRKRIEQLRAELQALIAQQQGGVSPTSPNGPQYSPVPGGGQIEQLLQGLRGMP